MPMNILLPTYSYYPYNFGGTEVYVSGLAAALIAAGHKVTIICATATQAFDDHGVFFEDDHIQATSYIQDGAVVIGAVLKQVKQEQLYFFENGAVRRSWEKIFDGSGSLHWDIIHFHAYTSLINLNIFEAAKKQGNHIKLLFSYHLPASCLKRTLLFANTFTDCQVKPQADVCSACYLSDRFNMPYKLSKAFVNVLPQTGNKQLPFIFRMKKLFGGGIASFQNLIRNCDHWFVFSKQIAETLLLNGVDVNRIEELQHGVAPMFLQTPAGNKRTGQQKIFLYAGRFDHLKGIGTLLKSWCSLEMSGERKLIIAGEGEQNDKRLAKSFELAKKRNDIEWIGKKSQRELVQVMDSAHCVIIPSEWVEIGPLIFHEAISRGCDVITSDIGGGKILAAHYSKKSSLFRAGDYRQLAKRILGFSYSNAVYGVPQNNENYRSVLAAYQRLLN